MNILSFLCYQSIAISSHTVDGHHVYSGGSVIGKTSIGIDISSPPLIFTGNGAKSAKFGVVLNITQI